MTQARIPSANIDSWTIAESERDDKPSLLRYRPGLKDFLGDSRFPRRLLITWTIADAHNGMPSAEESDEMRAMEDALVESLESADAGLLAFVFTHDGYRSWHFYVSGTADLGEMINDALGELPGLPIELEIADDPEWSELAELLGSVHAE